MIRNAAFYVSLVVTLFQVPDTHGFINSPSFLAQAFRRNRGSGTVKKPIVTSTSPPDTVDFPGDDQQRKRHETDSPAGAPGISSFELRNMNEARERRAPLTTQHEVQHQRGDRFVMGDALHVLRTQVLGMRRELKTARQERRHERVNELENAIWEAQQVDAEFVYHVSKERAQAAEDAGLVSEAETHRQEAARARRALPQFNLDGLWVGKYGEQGFEMINVTYSGDTLIAYKVTGDANVPKGQVSFSVNLDSPSPIEPIQLQHDAAEQWGSKFLPRFEGQGQVARRGYTNSQWLSGQLILVNQYFSFAWLPIAHQVFFGRPSAELTLQLLRESRGKAQNQDRVRDYLERCYEESALLDDEMEVSDRVFSSLEKENYYNEEGCFE